MDNHPPSDESDYQELYIPLQSEDLYIKLKKIKDNQLIISNRLNYGVLFKALQQWFEEYPYKTEIEYQDFIKEEMFKSVVCHPPPQNFQTMTNRPFLSPQILSHRDEQTHRRMPSSGVKRKADNKEFIERYLYKENFKGFGSKTLTTPTAIKYPFESPDLEKELYANRTIKVDHSNFLRPNLSQLDLVKLTKKKKALHDINSELSSATGQKSSNSTRFRLKGETLFLCDNKGYVSEIQTKGTFEYKNWGNFTENSYQCLEQTPDGNFQFAQDSENYMQQFFISERKICYDWGLINNCRILDLKITPDSLYFFIIDEAYVLKRFCISKKCQVGLYGPIYKENEFLSDSHVNKFINLEFTPDNQFVFINSHHLPYKQFEFSTKTIINWKEIILKHAYKNNREKVTEKALVNVSTSACCLLAKSGFVFQGYPNGSLRQFSFKSYQLISDYGIIGKRICVIKGTPDEKNLFFIDIEGKLKQWSIDKQIVIKNYGLVASSGVYCDIKFSGNSKFMFLAFVKTKAIKLYSIEEKKVLKVYKKVLPGTAFDRGTWSMDFGDYLFYVMNGGISINSYNSEGGLVISDFNNKITKNMDSDQFFTDFKVYP